MEPFIKNYPNYSRILQNLVCEMERDNNTNSKESDSDVCRVVLVMAEDLFSVCAVAAIAAQLNERISNKIM